MIDFSSKLGARTLQRIEEEFVIWLTTTDQAGVPQPRPVWFVWDSDAFLIYSQPSAKKLQHIARNPNVTLHFDGGPKGWDVQVLIGTAEIVSNSTPANQVSAYSQKYGSEIRAMGASEVDFAQAYSVAIRVRPQRLRGMLAPEVA